MLERHGVMGTWMAGSSRGVRGMLVDYRAGCLIVSASDGEHAGDPASFAADTGESGTELMRRILTAPTVAGLRYGAVREAIASVRAVALYGFSETRAWDDPSTYIVDTGEGSAAVVRFNEHRCFGAMVSLDPSRGFSIAASLARAPEEVVAIAEQVLSLPFLSSGAMAPVTAVFWGDGGSLVSAEDWYETYAFGAEILRSESLSDERWMSDAMYTYEVPEGVALAIAELATLRVHTRGVITVPEELNQHLVPEGAEHERAAKGLLAALQIAPRS
jgi:hypothetical protein